MKVIAQNDGARLRLSAPEAAMLSGLLDRLVDELEPDALDVTDPVRRRLFPSGYRDDDDSEQNFRELTEASLRAERVQRAEQCRGEIAMRKSAWRGSDVELDADGAERWMRVLNDLRLAIGTRLGISAESDYRLERGDPQLRNRAHYVWLTAVQDLLVQTLMDG